jgi:three-Cys-motif partner protein
MDPFGMDLEWSTVERIAETSALEIFLNFPVMALNRAAQPNAPHTLTNSQIERMNRFWGSNDWRDDIYEEQPTLFGNSVEIKISRTTGQRLGELFKQRLHKAFPCVSEPLVMTNSKNAPLYCLMLAGYKEKGQKIVEDIFKRYKRLGL